MTYLPEFLAFVASFAITIIATPVVIRTAHAIKVFDYPNLDRKIHAHPTPNLGGIPIFGGLVVAYSCIKDLYGFTDVKFMVPALITLFLVGIKDDVAPMSPLKKMLGQIFCAVLVAAFGNLRMTSLYGLFGVQSIPYILSIAITVLSIIIIINAFNLIDGIDGLAGGLGWISAMVYGAWFSLTNNHDLAILALSTAGALLGFLFYNFKKAKIFMGDTGALTVGLILAILSFEFIEINKTIEGTGSHFWIRASPAVAISCLAIPLFDLLRVFIIRILGRRSPFSADKNHIHHRLFDLGLSSSAISLFLYGLSFFLISLSIFLSEIRSTNLFLLICLICTIFFTIVEILHKKKFRN